MLSLLLLGFLASGVRAAPQDDIAAAWELVGRHLPGDALARLKESSPNGGREGAFARAVVLMDSQPVTDERLRAVVAQFLDLARGDDDLALASEYLAGRIYQVHLFDADGRRAAEIYAALAARRPESPWAQLALVKLALLKLYVLPEPSTPAARVAEVETYFARLTDRALVRDLHLVVGRARLFHGLPDFLPHLVAAAEAGGLVGVPRADLQIQIGELSRRAGQLEQAQKYFEQFLAENEVDGRVYAVRVRLAEVLAARGGTKTPPPS